jgi:hypothetical protein
MALRIDVIGPLTHSTRASHCATDSDSIPASALTLRYGPVAISPTTAGFALAMAPAIAATTCANTVPYGQETHPLQQTH